MGVKEIYNANKQRILTSLVLLFVVIVIAFMDNLFITWLFLGVVYLVSFKEAMTLFDIDDFKYYTYAVALWLAALIYPNPDDLTFVVLIVVVSMMVHKKVLNFKLLAPFLYPSVSMLFLIALYKDFGLSSLIWLFIVVSSADIGAYVVGKSMGKTPFSITSPNKTWEGVVGGILIATILGTLFGLTSVNLFSSLLVSFLVSLSSVWGDLFESYLKREAGVKDSGDIFPGHGGMLDRSDGYMFASIIMLVLLRGLL